jgi:hypothetical protein
LIQTLALAALRHLFQQSPHCLYPIDQTVEFPEFFSRQLLPAFGSLSDVAEAEEQLPDFTQRETDLTRPLDNREAIKHCGVVASLSTDSLGGQKYSNALVVAYGGRLKSDLSGNLGNR